MHLTQEPPVFSRPGCDAGLLWQEQSAFSANPDQLTEDFTIGGLLAKSSELNRQAAQLRKLGKR
jgi:hypothetical protein